MQQGKVVRNSAALRRGQGSAGRAALLNSPVSRNRPCPSRFFFYLTAKLEYFTSFVLILLTFYASVEVYDSYTVYNESLLINSSQ